MSLSIEDIEKLCIKSFTSGNNEERSSSEKLLTTISDSHNLFGICEQLLVRARNPYCQLFACNCLENWLRKYPTADTFERKVRRSDLRLFLLNFLYKNPSIEQYVIKGLCQSLARLTKLAWFDADDDGRYPHRQTIEESKRFFESDNKKCWSIGCQISSSIVNEMNRSDNSTLSQTLQRRLTSSFKDVGLYDMFNHSSQKLMDVYTENFYCEEPDLLLNMLLLINTILQYDFFTLGGDDMPDDSQLIQLPTNWKPSFTDAKFVRKIFSVCSNKVVGDDKISLEISTQSIQLASNFCSIRKSLFDSDERTTFLTELWQGITRIVNSHWCKLIFTDEKPLHQFGRMMVRLKSQYPLMELVQIENYNQVMTKVAEISVTALESFKTIGSNCLYYLLSFWQKCASSVVFARKSDIFVLSTILPEMCRSFLKCRLELAFPVISGHIDDPLTDESTLQQQMEFFSVISHFDYVSTCSYIISLFKEISNEILNAIQFPQYCASEECRIAEYKLAWLINASSAAVSGRTSYTEDEYDGHLCANILRFMASLNQKLAFGRLELIEPAILMFLDQFRRHYICSDESCRLSRAFEILSEDIGLNNELSLLQIFMDKIIFNLQHWSTQSNPVFITTIKFLSEVASAFPIGKRLVTLDSTKILMYNHHANRFPFLDISVSVCDIKVTKQRKSFYSSLGKLLLYENEDGDSLIQMVSVIVEPCLIALKRFSDIGQKSSDYAVLCIVTCKDMTGILSSLNNQSSYSNFFNWFNKNYAEMFIKISNQWLDDFQVSKALVTFTVELTNNRSQRLLFGVNSADGVILFRFVGHIIRTYGESIVNFSNSKTLNFSNDKSLESIKCSALSNLYNLMKLLLIGNFVNFGVMRYYNDQSLPEVLEIFSKTLSVIRLDQISSYPKLASSYYGLIEAIARDHTDFLTHKLNTSSLSFILNSISDGIVSFNTSDVAECSNALNNITCFFFKQFISKQNLVNSEDSQNPLMGQSYICAIPQPIDKILTDIMCLIMECVTFDSQQQVWSLSRPLYPLILLHGITHQSLFSSKIINRLPSDPIRSEKIAYLISELGDGLPNLSEGFSVIFASKHRDRFTQNLAAFRSSCKSLLLSQISDFASEGPSVYI